ncbi:MAG: membrane protein insertase YidC [bacterium]
MDKKFLFAMFLSFLTVWVIQQYFHKPEEKGVPQQVNPGQSYKVPSQQELNLPLNLEVDFIDKKITQKEQEIFVETDLYEATFSNYGAVLSSLDFKQYLDGYKKTLKTLKKRNFYEREQAVFLLALQEKTPYFYDFVGKQDLEDRIVVSFQAHADGWLIKKNYFLYKKIHKMDLEIEFEKKGKSEISYLKPRLFFAAPLVTEIEGNTQTGFYSDINGKIHLVSSGQEKDQAWVSPPVFGGQDKYFAHCLIKDESYFVQRGYFKTFSNNLLYSVLEGPKIEDKQTYKISFYLGPKTVNDLNDVDSRLEGLLSFGWFSWLCLFFVRLLNWFYDLLGNYGLAIIFLTVLLKIPFLPALIYSKKKMEHYNKYEPQIKAIRLKYKNNLALQTSELAKFHKDHNLSQFTVMIGCLPMLLQFPILIAFYKVVGNSLNLYQAPFFGWITDLSAKDPYYVLPVLMGVTMFWSQRLTSVKDERTKNFMMFMPIITTVIFLNFPAGVVLYWLVNNILTVAEEFLRKKIV